MQTSGCEQMMNADKNASRHIYFKRASDLNFLVFTVSGSTCTLERGMCTWSNTQNTKLDTLDWELTSSELEKHYPVPHEDHTLGTERGQ